MAPPDFTLTLPTTDYAATDLPPSQRAHPGGPATVEFPAAQTFLDINVAPLRSRSGKLCDPDATRMLPVVGMYERSYEDPYLPDEARPDAYQCEAETRRQTASGRSFGSYSHLPPEDEYLLEAEVGPMRRYVASALTTQTPVEVADRVAAEHDARMDRLADAWKERFAKWRTGYDALLAEDEARHEQFAAWQRGIDEQLRARRMAAQAEDELIVIARTREELGRRAAQAHSTEDVSTKTLAGGMVEAAKLYAELQAKLAADGLVTT